MNIIAMSQCDCTFYCFVAKKKEQSLKSVLYSQGHLLFQPNHQRQLNFAALESKWKNMYIFH